MSKSRQVRLAVSLILLSAVAGCGSDDDGDEGKGAATASADIAGLGTNRAVSGELTFTADAAGVRITGQVEGFEPASVHGFHLHQTGDCSDPMGMSAGGHWNPGSHKHGAPDSDMSHLGDLGNLIADANGVLQISITKRGASVGDGSATDVIGRAVIVHANPDDLMTDPTGDAGGRIACGVVK